MTTAYEAAFEQAHRQMEARRKGAERTFLHVRFLHHGIAVQERILEERYACRKMGDWTARGREYTVRNEPLVLPRFGVARSVLASRGRRATATRWLSRKVA
jgi:hypothetical protein